jgi:hypothetical protein
MAFPQWRMFIFETTGAAPVHRLSSGYLLSADDSKCNGRSRPFDLLGVCG